jgi:hypothetical protein
MDIFWNLVLLFLIIDNRAFEPINNQVEPQIPSHNSNLSQIKNSRIHHQNTNPNSQSTF